MSAKSKKESMEVSVTEDVKLRVILTREELLEAGQKLADAMQAIEGFNEEMQSFKEQIKGKITEAEGKAARYGAIVRQRYEYRDVACEITKDYTAKLYTVTRTDTQEIVEQRPMTADELQQLPMA